MSQVCVVNYTRETYSAIKTWETEAGEIAQLVKCLLQKREDMSSDPQHPHKKDGAAAPITNLYPNTGEENGQISAAH